MEDLTWAAHEVGPAGPFSTIPDYKAQQIEIRSRREPGTGQWLLESNQFQQWINREKQTFLCQGLPGSGKTMITCLVVDHLTKQYQNDATIGIAYIYCNVKAPDDQSPILLMASILKQLIRRRRYITQDPSLPSEEEMNQRITLTEECLTNELDAIIHHHQKIFILIDALDECATSDGTQSALLAAISILQQKANINLFITSRFIPDIAKVFQGCISMEIRASFEDIEKYVYNNLYRFPYYIQSSPVLQEELVRIVADACNGNFSVAQLSLESLAQVQSPEDMTTASRVLSSNPQIYDTMYKNYNDRIENQNADVVLLAKNVLLWMTYASRPLTLSELQNAVVISLQTNTQNGSNSFSKNLFSTIEVDTIISACGGLIIANEAANTINYIHPSANHYFSSIVSSWFPDPHFTLTEVCLECLLTEEFSQTCRNEEEVKVRLKKHPFYAYAAQHWAQFVGKIPNIKIFLLNESKVSSAYQVMFVTAPPERRIRDKKAANAFGTMKITGLHLAAYYGLAKAVSSLLEAGLSANPKDHNGRTPLQWAVDEGHTEVMKILYEKDRASLNTLIQVGNLELIKKLINVGYDINSKGVWDRTPLHVAVSAQDTELVKEFIAAGADVNCEDSDDITPLKIAIRAKNKELVELLLESGAWSIGIKVEEWYEVYQPSETDVMQLVQKDDENTCVRFLSKDQFKAEFMQSPPSSSDIDRYLYIFKDDWPWQEGLIPELGTNTSANPFSIESKQSDEFTFVCSATAWFPTGHNLQGDLVPESTKNNTLNITWTMAWADPEGLGPLWIPIRQYSMLANGWIPENGLNFLIEFLQSMKERWMALCKREQKYLSEFRREILKANGERPDLIVHLLRDTQKWSDFRSHLQEQIETGKKSASGYAYRFGEKSNYLADDVESIDSYSIGKRELRLPDKNVDLIQVRFEELEKDVIEQLELLDKTSQALIQIEFNLVSINEVRRSRSTATSMKRLSWITFIFLPAMFASSLFGMNVNILENNPDWRWYLLFMGATLILTLVGWLVFKFQPIERWVETNAEMITRRLNRPKPQEEDIEKWQLKRRNTTGLTS